MRDLFELPGEPVGRAVTGGGGKSLGVVGQRTQQCGGVDVFVVRPGESEKGCAAGEGADPGVGVTDQEERVAGALDEQLRAERGVVVPGRPQQSPPGGVGTEPPQQLRRAGDRRERAGRR